MGTSAHFCPDAVKVTPMDNYILRVEFEDGKVKDCDFTDHLDLGVFRKLRNKAFFSLAHASHGAIVWDDTLDCAPEYVYYDKGVDVVS